jgi:hypothetical protein
VITVSAEGGVLSASTDKAPGRGGCLSALLIAMAVVNLLVAVHYLRAGSTLARALPRMRPWMLYAFATIGFINTILVVAVWYWRKWAIFGLVVTALIVAGINHMIGIRPVWLLLGLAGPIILLALARPRWRSFH